MDIIYTCIERSNYKLNYSYFERFVGRENFGCIDVYTVVSILKAERSNQT